MKDRGTMINGGQRDTGWQKPKGHRTELHTGWGKKTQKLKDYSKQVKASAKELKINT